MNQKQKNHFNFGSDHYVHLSIINKIRNNNFQYYVKNINCYNEKNTAYPILFHWILAYFFYKSATTKPKRISFTLEILSIIFFNLFLLNLFEYVDWFYMLKANALFLIFPFSYVKWNAKNRGLSARGFGLLVGQLFTYSLVFYLEGYKTWLILLSLFSFIALLGSQFAFQYVVLISIITSIILGQFELLISVFTSLILFRFLFPKLSKEYLRGQYNHKKNYALYLAPIFILKPRPSIYRDFIYDFWIKLVQNKQEKSKTLSYIFSNPIVELIYGFPFLWVFLFYFLKSGPIEKFESISLLIVISLVIFFFISLRPFRFLGEPQRYVEYVIPLITISFLNYAPESIQLFVGISSLVFIVSTKFIFNLLRDHSNYNHHEITQFLKINFPRETIITSNDSNFSKCLIPYFNVVKTDLTRHYKDTHEFNFYHQEDYAIHSLNGLLEFHKFYKTNLIIINPQLYSQNDLNKLHEMIKLRKINSINNFIIYKTQDV